MKLFLLYMFVFCTFYTFSQNDTIITNYGLSNFVKIGDTKSEIVEKYGKPDKYHYTKQITKKKSGKNYKRSNLRIDKYGLSKSFCYYSKYSILIMFDHKKVSKIIIYNSNYLTQNNLSINSTLEDLKRVYRTEYDGCGNMIVGNIGFKYDCNGIYEITIYKHL